MAELHRQVLATGLADEIIMVDDGSTDGTAADPGKPGRNGSQTRDPRRRPRNQGKGAALRRGFAQATGDILLVQDADLEYDPADYPAPAPADPRGPGRRRLRLALPRRDHGACSTSGTTSANRMLTLLSNMLHQPEPDRHGDLLQGLPPRGPGGHRPPREPLRLRAGDHRQDGPQARSASTRCRSPTTGAPTRRARRSGRRTARGLLWVILKYGLIKRGIT